MKREPLIIGAAGRSIEMPVYDFSNHTRLKKGIIKKPAEVIIIEGILIFCEQALRGRRHDES